MNIVHLEPEEFVSKAAITGNHVSFHSIVLDNGIAGIVYLFRTNEYLYYMDRLEVSMDKEDEKRALDPELLHAEVYRKVALDNRSYLA